MSRYLLIGLSLAFVASVSANAAVYPPSLIREALLQHPALRAQAELKESAQAVVEGAKWQFWPTPSLGVEGVNTSAGDPNYRGDSTVTTLRLQQPLWTGGRLSGNLYKAEAQALAVLADVEITRQQLALRVIQAWSEAIAAGKKVVAYQQSRDAHARLLGVVERRTKDGVSAQADIDLARSRLDGTEADLATTRAQLNTAVEKLRLLVGRPLTTTELEPSARSLPPVFADSLDVLLAAAREQSPLLAKARAQGKIAESDVDVARASLSPEVFVRAERQYGNYSAPGQGPQNRVYIGLSTAFGGGFSSLSGIEAARARQRAAQEDLQSQQLVLEEQVQSDVILAQTAAQRRISIERAGRSATDVSASYERQFLAGRKQWQDLMNAAREQTQNDLQLADAIASQQLAGWRLAILTRGVDATLDLKSHSSSGPHEKLGADSRAPELPLPELKLSRNLGPGKTTVLALRNGKLRP